MRETHQIQTSTGGQPKHRYTGTQPGTSSPGAEPHLHTTFSFIPSTSSQPNVGYLREDSKNLPGGRPPVDIRIPPLELLFIYKPKKHSIKKSFNPSIVVENEIPFK